MTLTERAEKRRWRVAYILDRLPWFCWAELVWWVQNKGTETEKSLGACGSRSCREEAQTHRDRSCWCGKFREDCR